MTQYEAIEIAKLLKALIELSAVEKILSTFISAFKEKSILKDDGYYYLHGNFNLGGCVSGRMSSSNPNLQQLPSTSKFAKLIKKCFIAPKDWIMVSADFNSLEDMISALTTKDPNKLKCYIDGYDGHSLRAYAYFPEQFPDIVNTVESINSIAKLYPYWRQESKCPTFALTYQGTWTTLVTNLGLSKERAKQIETNYHELYKVSDEWVHSKLVQACSDGYVTCAFGLRVRTPILKQTILGNRNTPNEAKAEGRTAGNALGQSYCLLNNRAAIELQQRILTSPYALDIKPIAAIHDATYFIIKDKIGLIEWFNRNLIECMEWQELPEIQHDIVKLGAEMTIHYPSWKDEIGIPNNSNKQQILKICREANEKI